MAAFAAVAASYVAYMARIGEILHADIATEILTGLEIARQKTVFLKDWYHSTELFLVRTPLFVALWSLATDGILDAYRLAVATDLAIVIAAFLYMTKRLGAAPKTAALAMLAFFGARTYESGYGTGLGGASYGTMCATVFLILGRCAAARLRKENGLDRAVTAAITFMAFVFGLSSLRFLAVVFLPLLTVHVGMKLWSRLPQAWAGDRMLRLILAWTALSVLGWALTSRLILPRGFGPVDYQSSLANGLGYIASESLPMLLKELFRHNPVFSVTEPFRAFTLEGANGLLCLAFFVSCAKGIAGLSRPLRPARGEASRFLGLSVIAAVTALCLFQLAINLRIRYLVFLYPLLALAAAFRHADLSASRPARGRALLALTAAFCAVNALCNIKALDFWREDNISRVSVRRAGEIEDSLARHGLRRAYSLYWNSSSQTVLTDGRTEIMAVTGGMRPFLYLAPYDAYSPSRAGERTAFVRIDQPVDKELEELPQFKLTGFDVLAKATETEVIPDPTADVVIYYFDHNPFTFPPGHDPRHDRAKAGR
jgi:hypothetical protein